MKAENHMAHPLQDNIFGCIIRKKKSHFVDEIVVLFTFKIYFLTIENYAKNNIVFRIPLPLQL